MLSDKLNIEEKNRKENSSYYCDQNNPLLPMLTSDIRCALTSLMRRLWPSMLVEPCCTSFRLTRSFSKVMKQKFFGSLFFILSMGRMTSVTTPNSLKWLRIWTWKWLECTWAKGILVHYKFIGFFVSALTLN